MNKYLNIVEIFLKKESLKRQTLEKKLNFFRSFIYEYEFLCKESVSSLLKLFYISFSNLDINIIEKYGNFLEKYFDKIESSDFKVLSELYDILISNFDYNTIHSYKIKKDNYITRLNKFKEFKFDEKLIKFIEKIFTSKSKIDFDAYNMSIDLIDDNDKLKIFKEIIDLLEIRNCSEKNLNLYEAIIMKKTVIEHFPYLVENIAKMSDKADELEQTVKDNNELYNIKKNLLEICKNNIINNRKININEVKKTFPNSLLLLYMIEYNNSLVNEEYSSILNDIKELNNNQVNLKERILATYKCNVDSSKILIDSNELEQYINLIDKSIPNVKKYNNIMLLLLNKLSLNELEYLSKLINDKLISERFLLDNIIDIISNIDNFIKNIELLKTIFNIKDIIKFDKNILYLDNEYIKYLINIYKLYNINFNSDIHNFDFLKKDYSYQIDKFIEIGLYDLIKNNIGLLGSETDIIIKRCLFNKYINEPILNDNNKLCGYIRKEETYLLSDEELKESMLENYTDLIPIDIIEVLSSNVTNFTNSIDVIDNYLVNDMYYNFDGMLVSKNKVLRNYSKLKDLNISESDKILYSILYNYPSIITKENICFLNNILKIKIKSKR